MRKPIKLPHAAAVLRFLEKNGIPYQVDSTNSTDKITAILPKGKTVWLCGPNDFKPAELGFIKRVKKCALNSRCKPEWNTARHISYYRFRDLPPGNYDGVTEVDVNGAYWNIAYQKGIIDQAIWSEGKTVPKLCRLAALGAMATRPRSYEWKPETGYTKPPPPEYTDDQQRLRSYFFDIASHLDRIMTAGIEAHDVLFYWVDAFFVQDHAADTMFYELAKHGLSAKTKPVKEIQISRTKSGKRVALARMINGEEKPFLFGSIEERAEYHLNRALDIVLKNA